MNLRIGHLACVLPFTALLACSVSAEPTDGAGQPEATGAHSASAAANGPISEAHETARQSALATITVGPEHTLNFIELSPGSTAVLEDAPLGTATVLPENVRELQLSEVYRRFAPAGAEVPANVIEADSRQATAAAGLIARPGAMPEPTATPDGEPLVRTLTPENAGENSWFNSTFCNGANGCTFGSGHIATESNNNITYGYVVSMNGSEATSNATMQWYYWGACVCTDQILWWCGSYACSWQYVGGGSWNVVPGHWISVSITEGSATTFYWQMWGGAQQMGMATRWH